MHRKKTRTATGSTHTPSTMRTTIKLTATPGTAYKRVCHAFGGFFECGANNVFWDWELVWGWKSMDT